MLQIFDTGSQVMLGWPLTHCIARNVLELLILLPPLAESWGYRCASEYLIGMQDWGLNPGLSEC